MSKCPQRFWVQRHRLLYAIGKSGCGTVPVLRVDGMSAGR